MREIGLSARLAAVGTQRALAADLASGRRAAVAELLADLSRDERIFAAEVCTPALATISRSPEFPERLSCEALRGRVSPTALPAELVVAGDGDRERIHVSIHPVEDRGGLRGALVLVHDVGFIA